MSLKLISIIADDRSLRGNRLHAKWRKKKRYTLHNKSHSRRKKRRLIAPITSWKIFEVSREKEKRLCAQEGRRNGKENEGDCTGTGIRPEVCRRRRRRKRRAVLRVSQEPRRRETKIGIQPPNLRYFGGVVALKRTVDTCKPTASLRPRKFPQSLTILAMHDRRAPVG